MNLYELWMLTGISQQGRWRMEYYLNESMSRSQLWQEDNYWARCEDGHQLSHTVGIGSKKVGILRRQITREVGGTLQLEAAYGLTFAPDRQFLEEGTIIRLPIYRKA